MSLSNKEVKKILSNYNLGKLKSKRKIYDFWNTVYKIKTSSGFYILKELKRTTLKMIQQESRIHQALKDRLPIQKLILTKDNKMCIKNNNKNYLIKEYIAGKTIDYGRKPNIELISQVGRYCAEINRTKVDFQLKKVDIIKKMHDFYKKIDKKSREYEVFQAVFSYLEKAGFNKAKFTKGLAHRDLHRGNYIIKDNKIQAILDFDESCYGVLIVDIGLCLYDLAILKGLDKKRMTIFINAYNKIRPITKEERKHLINSIIFMGIHSLHYLIIKNGTSGYNFNNSWIKKYMDFIKSRGII